MSHTTLASFWPNMLICIQSQHHNDTHINPTPGQTFFRTGGEWSSSIKIMTKVTKTCC